MTVLIITERFNLDRVVVRDHFFELLGTTRTLLFFGDKKMENFSKFFPISLLPPGCPATYDELYRSVAPATNQMFSSLNPLSSVTEEFGKVTSSVQKAADMITKTVSDVGNTASELLVSARASFAPIEKIAKTFDGIIEGFSATVKLIWDILIGYPELSLPTFGLLLVQVLKSVLPAAYLPILRTGLILALTAGLGINFLSYITEFFEKATGTSAVEGIVPQSFALADVLAPLASIYVMLGVSPDNKNEFIKALKDLPHFARGAQYFLDAFISFSVKLSSFVSARQGWSNDLASLFNEDYKNWINSVNKVAADNKNNCLDSSSKGIMEVESIIERGVALQKELHLKGEHTLTALVLTQLKSLTTIVQEMHAESNNGNDRPMPVSVIFRGKPGFGKSLAMNLLMQYLIRDELTNSPQLLAEFDANPASFIYVRSKDPYLDDFSPKKMGIILDDFPNMLTTSQEDAAWPSLIDMLNTTRKPVPVANLEIKGAICYNQIITGITTNATSINDPLLISIDAVASRLNFIFTVSSDAYDGVSLRDAKPKEFSPDIWQFTLNVIDGTKFVETGIMCNFVDVLALVKLQIAKNRETFETRRVNSAKLYDQTISQVNESLIPHVYGAMRAENEIAPDTYQYLTRAQDLTKTLEKASNSTILTLFENGVIDEEIKSRYLKPENQMMRSLQLLDLTASVTTEEAKVPSLVTGISTGVLGTRTQTDGPDRVVIRAFASAQSSAPGIGLSELRARVKSEAGFFKQDVGRFSVPIPYVSSKFESTANLDNSRVTLSLKFSPGETLGRIVKYILSLCHLLEDQAVSQEVLRHYNLSEVELLKKLLSYGFHKEVILKARKKIRTLVMSCGVAPRENWKTIVMSYKETKRYKVTFYDTVIDAFETAGSKLISASKRIMEFVGENYRTICLALTCLAGFSALYAYSGKPIPEKLYAVPQDSGVNNALYLRRIAIEGKVKRANLSATTTVNQDYVPNLYSIYPKVLKSMFWVKTPEGESLGAALNIEAKLFLMPRHYFDKIKETIVVQSCRTKETYRCEVDLKYLYDGEEVTDVAIVRLINKQMPSGANLTVHFTNKGDIFSMFYNSATEVFLLAPNMNLVRRAFNESTDPEPIKTDRSKVQHNDARDFITDTGVKRRVDLISYAEPTIGGCCGMLVFYNNKIVGMHTGGNGDRGFAAKIDRTMFHWYKNPEYQEYLKKEGSEDILDPPSIDFFGAYNQSLGYDVSVHNGEISAVLEKPRSTYVVEDIVPYKGKTSFFVPTVAPVRLGPKSFEDSRRKLVPIKGTIDDGVMRHVAEQMALRDRCIPWDGLKVPYDLKTCLMGLPGTGFKAMPRDTSPGFPFALQNKTRKDIFSVTESGQLVLGPLMPEVLNAMENFVQASLSGGSTEIVFLDNMKYENRPLNKLDKARVVSSTPFFHFVLGRQMFGPFFRWMSETAGVNNYLTGVNPYEDWHHMEVKFLEKDGETRSCAGDYSSFDKSHRLIMIEYVWLYIELWFGEDGYFGSPRGKVWGQVRRSLLESSIIGKHLYSCVLEIQPQGMASGCATTTSTNCVIGAMNLHYSYIMEGLKRIPNATKHGLSDKFYQDVYFKVLGDDIRFSVSERTDFFDNFAFRDQLAILGYKYGSADKESELTAFLPASKAGLLKRYPRFDKETKRWYGPIDLEVILNMMCYHTKNRPETILDRANSAIRELAFHDQETWDLWFPRILAHVGPDYVPPGLFRLSVLEDMTTITRGIYTQSLSSELWKWAFFTNGMKFTKELSEMALVPSKIVMSTLEVLSTSDVPFLAFIGNALDLTADLALRKLPDFWAPYIDDGGNSTGKFEKDFPFIANTFSSQQIPEREIASIEKESDFYIDVKPIPEKVERAPCAEQPCSPRGMLTFWSPPPEMIALKARIEEMRKNKVEPTSSEQKFLENMFTTRVRKCEEAQHLAVTKPCLI
jgi:hypothetical protein